MTGRAKPGSEFEIPVDPVILALGFTGVAEATRAVIAPISFAARGTVSVDAEFRTPVDGVFAADGRRMAASIDRYLSHPSFPKRLKPEVYRRMGSGPEGGIAVILGLNLESDNRYYGNQIHSLYCGGYGDC